MNDARALRNKTAVPHTNTTPTKAPEIDAVTGHGDGGRWAGCITVRDHSQRSPLDLKPRTVVDAPERSHYWEEPIGEKSMPNFFFCVL